jgi:DUF1680 family protein
LAIVAKASSSFVSGDTSLTALNDGFNPRNSRQSRGGQYGNWPRRGAQWVEYEWSQPISTNQIDVYWWADGQGVNLPQSSTLKYWNGSSFVPVPNAQGLGVESNRFNTTTFDEVTTSKLRLEFEGQGTSSTGILEWKVYDTGKSPAFPPAVVAGIDRVVVVGGKTYLNPTVKSLKPEASSANLSWSKDSGPGEVTFAEPKTAVTTATFSTPGHYVLKLTASEGALSSSSTVNVKVETPPPSSHLELIDTRAYKINSPLWNHRAKALIVNWIPHCYNKISDPNLREGGINNLIEAGKKLRGEESRAHIGYPFSNAWIYNTLESVCVALMVDPQGDPEIIKAQEDMKKVMEEWIPLILAAQEPDGYLQTRYTLGTARDRQRNVTPQRWSAGLRSEHEGYVAGYYLEAAIAHYMYTNGADKRLYDSAKKLADCWDKHIGPAPKQAWFDGHQAMEMALVRFGRFVDDIEGEGKGTKYIQLAKFLLDCRGGGQQYDQSHLPVQQQYEAVGHAVRAAYNYAAMSDVAMETQDRDYQSAVASLWDNIVNRKYYLTGGIGSGETSEGFGPDYSLRNNSYCESCSNIGLLYFQHRLHLAQNHAKYADLYEESFYNAILGDIDLEGKNFYYQNPLDSNRARYAWHQCPCCVGNIPRALLMMPTWMYSKDARGIYVNLFAGSTVKVPAVAGTDVELLQDTDYPWSGKVAITVKPSSPREFAMRIRMPSRSVSDLYTSTPAADGITSISVNGARVNAPAENGYAVISRTWQSGDKIEVELPMVVQRVKCIDKVAANVGRVALMYGPLVYNVEQVDNPNLGSREGGEPVLSPDTELLTEWKPDLLGGVVVIKGKWADGSPLMAVPNYARNNRGEQGRHRSIVWNKDQ